MIIETISLVAAAIVGGGTVSVPLLFKILSGIKQKSAVVGLLNALPVSNAEIKKVAKKDKHVSDKDIAAFIKALK